MSHRTERLLKEHKNFEITHTHCEGSYFFYLSKKKVRKISVVNEVSAVEIERQEAIISYRGDVLQKSSLWHLLPEKTSIFTDHRPAYAC